MSRTTPRRLSLATGALLGVVACSLWLCAVVLAPRAESPAPPRHETAETPRSVRVGPSNPRRSRKPDASVRHETRTPDAADAGAPTATLAVRVVAADSREPIGGAYVEVTDGDCEGWACQCDATGCARFEALAPGATEIRTWSDETVESARTVVLSADAKATVEIALDAAAAIEGVVVDATDGAPLASVVVESALKTDAGDRPLRDERTDESGRFRIEHVPPASVVVVRAATPGRSRIEATVTVAGAATARTELRLQRAGSLRGVVRDPDGRPAAGASVRVARASARDAAAQPRSAQCGPDGSYVADDLVVGERLTVTAESAAWVESEPSPVTLTAAAADVALDLRLRQPAVIALHVTGPGGDPVPRARALFDGRPESWTWTEDDGVIRRRRLPSGHHTFVVQAEGFASARGDAFVAEGGLTDVDVAMDHGGTISGVVVDRQGDPVAGVYVYASPPAPARARDRDWSDGALTDATGAFAVTGAGPGSYELFVFGTPLPGLAAPGRDGARTTATSPSSGARIVVDRGVTASLRVTLPPGVARTPDVVVAQIFQSNPAMNAPVTGGAAVAFEYDAWVRDGVLRCRVTPRVSWLRVRVPGLAPDMVPIVPAELGTSVDLGEMRLHSGLTLHGRVVDAAGHPAAGAAVTTSADDKTTPLLRTREDGTFDVEHLGPGPLVARAETDSRFGAVSLRSADDAAQVTVVVRRKGLLRGVVTDESGSPVKGASVSILHGGTGGDDHGREASVTTDDAGRFSATVAAGPCRGTVTTDGSTTWFEAIVPEGGDVAVRAETTR